MTERLSRTAIWRCLHTQGHDVAQVAPALSGWHLTGMAAFRGDDGPVAVNYTVEMDDAWLAKRGSLRGIAGGRRFFHAIERKEDGWTLDGKWQGLSELVDLDFGFTPATNLQQLTRAGLAVGERAGFSVAWFDIGKDAMVELPQIYERRDETHYWYQSPENGYEAILAMDESGFVRDYPGLWRMDDGPAEPASPAESGSSPASPEEDQPHPTQLDLGDAAPRAG